MPCHTSYLLRNSVYRRWLNITMRASFLTFLATSAALSSAQSHGEGEEGNSMGPVAFLWPSDRVWDAQHDNTAPCGSSTGPSNRTIYPLSQGAVALSIADEAWHIAFRLAVSDSKHRLIYLHSGKTVHLHNSR